MPNIGSSRKSACSVTGAVNPHPVPNIKNIGVPVLRRFCKRSFSPPSNFSKFAPVTTTQGFLPSSRVISDGVFQRINNLGNVKSIFSVGIVDKARIWFPESEDLLHHLLLVFNRSYEEVFFESKCPCSPRDVVDIKISYRSSDFGPLFRADWTMDETNVSGDWKMHAI